MPTLDYCMPPELLDRYLELAQAALACPSLMANHRGSVDTALRTQLAYNEDLLHRIEGDESSETRLVADDLQAQNARIRPALAVYEPSLVSR